MANINLDLFGFCTSLKLKSTFILSCNQWLGQIKQELVEENKNENTMIEIFVSAANK